MELLIYNSHMYQARKNNKRSIFIFLGISEVPNDHLVDLIEVDFE
jgi:hypothetical protein